MLMRTPTRWARPKLVRPPGFIVPCRPTLAANVPTGDGWLHELKHDGFRIIAHKDGLRVHLWSRNGRDRSGDLVAIADAVRALPASRVVIDGEAVAHCLEGLPHFNRLLSGDAGSAEARQTARLHCSLSADACRQRADRRRLASRIEARRLPDPRSQGWRAGTPVVAQRPRPVR